MSGHRFEVAHVHRETGEIDVRWDGQDARVMTCRIPFGPDGKPLADAEFKKAIMNQCMDRLEHWDRAERNALDAVVNLVGRRFDVTEEYAFRKVNAEAKDVDDDEFKLEDHV